MTTATIRANHSVREDFAECSTGNPGAGYYDTKGSAVRAYESALAEYDLCFDRDNLLDMAGDDGRIEIDIYTNELECSFCVCHAIIMWHRMESGRYEFTGYIT